MRACVSVAAALSAAGACQADEADQSEPLDAASTQFCGEWCDTLSSLVACDASGCVPCGPGPSAAECPSSCASELTGYSVPCRTNAASYRRCELGAASAVCKPEGGATLFVPGSACQSEFASVLAEHCPIAEADGWACAYDLDRARQDDVCRSFESTETCLPRTTADHVQVCGIAVARPVEPLTTVGGEAQDTTCFAPATFPPKPGTPATTSLQGTLRVLSHGCESASVTIEALRVQRDGGPDDGLLGEAATAAVTTPASCQPDGVATPDADCGTRWECRYTLQGVPTETELVIRTSGAGWATVAEYGVLVASGQVTAGIVQRDVWTVSADDFQTFPAIALGTTTTAGNGWVFGELRDCAGRPLRGATLSVPGAKAISYFTDDASHPLPDTTATFTGARGLYGAFDLTPGLVTVTASGNLGGEAVTIGYLRVRVFPDTLTLVTPAGVLPTQVP